MSYLKHPEVVSSVYSKFEKAKSSGALFFYPSTRSRATEHNINFEITTCPALQKKPALPAPDFSKRDKPDPFAPPYVPDLFIGELKDELEGDEYVILVRTWADHCTGFHPQNSPLTPPELTQAYLLIRASQKAESPIFAFYNCGVDSGASQPHKHIQFVPTKAEEDDEDEDDSRPPVESYVQNLKIEDDTKVFSLPLPYVHLVQRLHLPKATVSGTKLLSEQALEELSSILTRTFLGLLDEAVQTIRIYHSRQNTTTGTSDVGRASAPSYNIILTSEHMHLIPRLREHTIEELHPNKGEKSESDPEAYTPQKLSINSLGFAGMLLAKSDALAGAIKEKGVIELLSQVGVPNKGETSNNVHDS
ncbi:ATP adenylyltransferase domain-containing protein [Rhizoctonia solani AG-1 IA]|uniref:ATP adenylyltransferase domain-containing protein n=1 Tax=Thanatephorus cucumeris (strain AG1-IA) TaxID=983506 RepID=L8WER3_THACA|nr:ATP adenylyltransferase domain-containing protein [Rhizoctonia solani AG-1 IA]